VLASIYGKKKAFSTPNKALGKAISCYQEIYPKGTRDYSYIFHLPHTNQAWVGTDPAKTITLSPDFVYTVTDEHGCSHSFPADTNNLFSPLKEVLDPKLPTFFLISSDLKRSVHDTDLSLAVFIQPQTEIGFSESSHHEFLSVDVDHQNYIRKIVERCQEKPFLAPTQAAPENYTNWISESDDDFAKRLSQSVVQLQTLDGKMIITRPYQCDIPQHLDSFRLYEIYSSLETECAANHLCALPNSTLSFSCSPENVFEAQGRSVIVDILASTRGRLSDKRKDKAWQEELLKDAKETYEHRMTYDRFLSRFKPYCVADSIDCLFYKKIRDFRRVRHLYSQISGTINTDMDVFRLLEISLPPLCSYPDNLIPLSDPMIEPNRYYGGIFGRIAPGFEDASAFLNIRAALVKGQTLHTQGGVGVLKESKPNQELLEVKNKLACLMEACSMWQGEKNAS
jgi:anthranilate/para-aminobenzoate synthase component I